MEAISYPSLSGFVFNYAKLAGYHTFGPNRWIQDKPQGWKSEKSIQPNTCRKKASPVYVMQLIKHYVVIFFLILNKYLLSNFVFVILSYFLEEAPPSRLYML